MPRYIRLVRLTEEGVKNVSRLDDILADVRKIFEANGAKVVESYSTLGRYDFVAIVEAPDDATMMKISALVGRGGHVHAETLPAVPTPDFAKSVAAGRKPSRSRVSASPKGRARPRKSPRRGRAAGRPEAPPVPDTSETTEE